MPRHLLALAILALGCSARPSLAPERTEAARALDRGAHYLLANQSDDGAWRSDVYASFRDGDALTPLVLHALLHVAPSPARDAALRRGRAYLASPALVARLRAGQEHRLNYPTYTAALAVLVLEDGDARAAWLAFLRRRQLAEPLGWQSDDLAYGGWGLVGDPPPRPPGAALPPFAQANLSATVFALDALRAAGCRSDDPACARALRFVRRCQNLAPDEGGFFFSAEDVVRNKAGGTEPGGYHSYGSATADGLRAYLACGLTEADAGVQAARAWLRREFVADRHPGRYVASQEPQRDAVYYYYGRSVALTGPEPTWAAALTAALVRRQRADGSWRGDLNAQREDDPLLATACAVTTLGNCRAR